MHSPSTIGGRGGEGGEAARVRARGLKGGVEARDAFTIDHGLERGESSEATRAASGEGREVAKSRVISNEAAESGLSFFVFF